MKLSFHFMEHRIIGFGFGVGLNHDNDFIITLLLPLGTILFTLERRDRGGSGE